MDVTNGVPGCQVKGTLTKGGDYYFIDNNGKANSNCVNKGGFSEGNYITRIYSFTLDDGSIYLSASVLPVEANKATLFGGLAIPDTIAK